MTTPNVDELLAELVLLRSGRPYHTHHDVRTGEQKTCTSPYCIDLTMQGIRQEPHHA